MDTQGYDALPPDYTEETGMVLVSTVDPTIYVGYRFPRPQRFTSVRPYAVYALTDSGAHVRLEGVYETISAACGAGRSIARDRMLIDDDGRSYDVQNDDTHVARTRCDACGAACPVGVWRRAGFNLCDTCHDANPIPTSYPPIPRDYPRIRDWGEREGLRAGKTYTIGQDCEHDPDGCEDCFPPVPASRYR